MNWTEAAVTGESITQVDEAKSGDKLIVLFVYSDSEERKHARATAKSKAFVEKVLGTYGVATALQGCATIRVDGTKLSRDIRTAYKLSTAIPQVLLMDINGKVLFKATISTTKENLAKMITAAKLRVAKIVADRDR